jgi:hypothetical protein
VDLVRDLSSFFSPPRSSLHELQTPLGTQAPVSTPATGSEGNSSSPRSDANQAEGTPSSDILALGRCPSMSEADSRLRVGSESESMHDYVRP